MARRRIKPEELPDIIGEIRKEYTQELSDGSVKVVTEIAKAGVDALKSASKGTFNGNKYWQAWDYQIMRMRYTTRAVIYSRIPGLPHLLEHGHAARDGGRVAGRVHIAPIADALEKDFVEEMEAEINDI